MNGERYLGNVNTMEVHDLDNTNCQIDEIIAAGHDRPYTSHQAAKDDGFDNGHYCIGGSTR
jgi:hypothetical protein